MEGRGRGRRHLWLASNGWHNNLKTSESSEGEPRSAHGPSWGIWRTSQKIKLYSSSV